MSLVRCYFFSIFVTADPFQVWDEVQEKNNETVSQVISQNGPLSVTHTGIHPSQTHLGWCWEFDTGFRPGITNKFNSGHLKIQLTYWVFVSAWFITQLPWVWISVSRTHFQPWRLQENRIAIFMIQIGGIQDVLSVNRREPFLRSQAFVFERVC